MPKKTERHLTQTDVEMIIWLVASLVALGVIMILMTIKTDTSNMELDDYVGVAVAVVLPLFVAHATIDGLRDRWQRKKAETLPTHNRYSQGNSRTG